VTDDHGKHVGQYHPDGRPQPDPHGVPDAPAKAGPQGESGELGLVADLGQQKSAHDREDDVLAALDLTLFLRLGLLLDEKVPQAEAQEEHARSDLHSRKRNESPSHRAHDYSEQVEHGYG